MIRSLSLAVAGSLLASIALTPGADAQTSSEIYQLLDAGTYVLLVELPIRPERHDDFLKIIRARIEASRHRPEIVDFRVMSTPDANVFVAVERFRDKAASAAFEALPESKAFLDALKPMVGGNVEATVLTPLQ